MRLLIQTSVAAILWGGANTARGVVTAAMVVPIRTSSVRYMALPRKFRQGVATAFVAGAVFMSTPSFAIAKDEHVWQLENGDVRLEDHLVLLDKKRLDHPRLLGSGGGGAVFGFENSDTVLKVSWIKSSESVKRECSILEVLQQHQVQGVETCLGVTPYPDDLRRVMIALQPRMEDEAVASVAELKDNALEIHAVQQIMQTLVQMLAANVVTVDVQPLISTQTGKVLLIDMTEARVLKQPLSDADLALVSAFCNEIMALIPEPMESIASKALTKELEAQESRGVPISDQVYAILRDLPLLMSQET